MTEPDNQPGVSIQEYVDAVVGPFRERVRAGDVTLREYLEHIIDEHRRQVERELERVDVLVQERVRRIEVQADERWDRVEEQIRNAIDAGLQAVDQLRRERELVTSAQSVAIAKAEQATTIAIEKAEQATDKRFESVNEFRAQQQDIIHRFLPREVAETQFAEMRRAIESIVEKLSKIT